MRSAEEMSNLFRVEVENDLLRLAPETKSILQKLMHERKIDEAHDLYYEFCRQTYSLYDRSSDTRGNLLAHQGFEAVPNLISSSTVQAFRKGIDDYVESKDPMVLEWEEARTKEIEAATDAPRFLKDITLRKELHPLCVSVIQEVLSGSVTAKIEEALGSFFYVNHLLLGRTYPTKKVGGSFLWHRDYCVNQQLHLMIYLTDAPASGGGGSTEFLSAIDTKEIEKKANYGLVGSKDRVSDLNDLSVPNRWNERLKRVDLKAGDGIMFFARQVLHRGIPPTHSARDTLTFVIKPSLNPWNAELAHFDHDLFLKRSCTYDLLGNHPATI